MSSLAVDKVRGLEPIRVSHIAGRYLVFDPDAVSRLRRCENTSGTLVGTTPQQPTQNVFLGLPVELRPEEVCALLQRNAAYVADDVDAHNMALRSNRSAAMRTCYVATLRNSKRAAHYTLAQRSSTKAARRPQHHERRDEGGHCLDSRSEVEEHTVSVALDSKSVECDNQATDVGRLAVTPVSSATLVASVEDRQSSPATSARTLCGFLQSCGHYMTPGLRFGSEYSVYPGDPLRFHAHFMANEYGWEEEIPMLDIVGGGRLATAVKKAFLMGGRDESTKSNVGPIRTYSIEWAAM